MTAAAKTRWSWRPACPVSVGIWLAVVVLAFPLVPDAQAHSPYETPPVMKVTDLAPAGLIVGQGYRVGENVPTTGLLGAFALEADVGTLDAHGLHLLRIRIGELGAIRQLEETSKTAEFAKAAGRAAMRPVEATVNMVAHPVDTISGMPASVGRFFDRVKLGGESIAQAASAPDKGGMERTADVGERIGAVTINPILSKKLTDVAWVTFSAREAVNLTTAVVMPYSMVMSTVSLTNNLIWDMKPADLVAPNQKKATDMGAGDEAASALIANKNYSISALTALMTALERLGPILGRADVVALAATAANEDQARFLMGSAQMLAHHHEWVTPLATVMARGTVVGKTATGGLVVGAPVDYVVWTANVANFARRPDFAATSRDIWLTSRMSPRARHEFERIGWRVHEGSPTAVEN